MPRFVHRLAVFATTALLTGVVFAADSAVPADSGLAADIVVNGQPISVNHVKLMETGLNVDKTARGVNDDAAKTAARAELITQEVLAQAARKDGLDKSPEVADQIAFQERAILSRAYLENYFDRNPINEQTLKTAYEWKRANGKILEYKIRQVLVTSEDAALQVIAALNKGGDFAAVAKQYTQDPGGQESGGDLGWFKTETFVDHHFTDAVESLKKGQYTRTPVRSRFGWHVIKLDDGPRPVANATPYDALDDGSREALRQRTAQMKIESLTAQLTAGAKISGPGVSGATQKSAK